MIPRDFIFTLTNYSSQARLSWVLRVLGTDAMAHEKELLSPGGQKCLPTRLKAARQALSAGAAK